MLLKESHFRRYQSVDEPGDKIAGAGSVYRFVSCHATTDVREIPPQPFVLCPCDATLIMRNWRENADRGKVMLLCNLHNPMKGMVCRIRPVKQCSNHVFNSRIG